MSNIRVDVGYTIKDGTEIKFRSPVDCSAITGLIVYYPEESGKTASTVFALSDAHGNNVGDIDHLFAEDVVVKVILDVTKKMAFVQNADTNKYIEETFVKKTDTLKLEQGGTGASNSLVDAPKNAIIKKIGTGTKQLYYTPTKAGVFCAEAENGAPEFVPKLPLKYSGAPSLSENQKTALTTLASAYLSKRSKFKYDGSSIRNIYTDDPDYSPFDVNGKIKTNCGLFVGLIWAGVDPSTFDNFNGNLEMAFDWGYQFLYPYRSACGVKREDESLYGFLQPNEPDYTGSSSYNSYYDPTVTNRADKQRFFSYATAADMAAEMFVRGFEVPLREVEVGDILFYNCRSLVDNLDDDAESFRFRNITHVAIVTRLDKKDQGSIRVTESTSLYGASLPIAESAPDMGDNANKLRGVYLMNHIVMAARHPAAFGVASNIYNTRKFNVL